MLGGGACGARGLSVISAPQESAPRLRRPSSPWLRAGENQLQPGTLDPRDPPSLLFSTVGLSAMVGHDPMSGETDEAGWALCIKVKKNYYGGGGGTLPNPH